ncbi:phage head spike fiber domain-containing protein [Furfurilactobacillus curtus]|uniref:Uncharacterized protein n=1 Tax=Furfurilactobacillus curtus TaxID=1746200 RepID=A0ABQ5JK92_9LACO
MALDPASLKDAVTLMLKKWPSWTTLEGRPTDLVNQKDLADAIQAAVTIKGADGKTSYTHIAYANSADGKDGFYVGGGTNLYTDTKNFDNLASWWGSSSWTKTTDTYNGLAVMQTTRDWSGLSQYIQVKKGDILTYSVYAKNTSGTGTSTIYWQLNGNPEGSYSTASSNPANKTVTITDSWQRVSATIVATSDGYLRPRIERSNENTNTIQIAGIKLEKGSVATSWSPAPAEAHPIYMGTYTDFTQADSLDPTAYQWSLIADKPDIPRLTSPDGSTWAPTIDNAGNVTWKKVSDG